MNGVSDGSPPIGAIVWGVRDVHRERVGLVVSACRCRHPRAPPRASIGGLNGFLRTLHDRRAGHQRWSVSRQWRVSRHAPHRSNPHAQKSVEAAETCSWWRPRFSDPARPPGAFAGDDSAVPLPPLRPAKRGRPTNGTACRHCRKKPCREGPACLSSSSGQAASSTIASAATGSTETASAAPGSAGAVSMAADAAIAIESAALVWWRRQSNHRARTRALLVPKPWIALTRPPSPDISI